MPPLWKPLILLGLLPLLSILPKQPGSGLAEAHLESRPTLARIIAQGLTRLHAESRVQSLQLLSSLNTSEHGPAGMVGWLIGSTGLQQQEEDRPFNSKIIPLRTHMDLTVEFWLQKDEFGRRDLVIGNCCVKPSSVSMLLIEDVPPKTQSVLSKLRENLEKVIPQLVASQVCPLMEEILRQLDVKLLKSLLGECLCPHRKDCLGMASGSKRCLPPEPEARALKTL
ncbi:BPI fold-containing family A member 3 isoform X3 [Echinops telfairi]|uniref:BPI fold-containing family A member 3 isoform X3 n=1 Tax=Echinops telfairi TaxID=9371 RepID=A0AC55DIA3_ECHTE|nr:BPI fold-containing family A member 3 isoform X3 [Echinops telfairi]